MNYVKGDKYHRREASGWFIFDGEKWPVVFPNKPDISDTYPFDTEQMERFVRIHREQALKEKRDGDYVDFFPVSPSIQNIKREWLGNGHNQLRRR